MAFNERQQTLTALRGMKADFDAIQTSQNKIDLLEKQVILADRDYQRESEKIEEEYRKITKRKTEQLDPEKEAAKKIPRLSREEIRKKCLPHLIAVTAMCLIWIIASFVFLNQQISPDTTKAKIAGMMTARILYVLGVVITLLMHSGDGSRSMVVGGCLVYSIPGITVFVGAILNYGTFTNVGLLSILDIALGLGAWIAALFAPSPNKAYFKEVEAAKADKAKKLEHIDEEAKNAFSDLRYEKEKTVIALRKQAAPAQEKVNALRAQLAKEKGIISAAEDRLLACTSPNLAQLSSPPDYIEQGVLKNGQFAVEYMISAVERRQASTMAEAIHSWDLEVERRAESFQNRQPMLDVIADLASRNGPIV